MLFRCVLVDANVTTSSSLFAPRRVKGIGAGMILLPDLFIEITIHHEPTALPKPSPQPVAAFFVHAGGSIHADHQSRNLLLERP